MSATGRGAKRAEADFYPTPARCVTRLLAHADLPRGRWLEPSAGDGAIIRAVHSVQPTRRVDAFELRPECREPLEKLTSVVQIGDFLAMEQPTVAMRYQLAIGNPPYSLAQEFVEHSLLWADEVVFLLRLNFLGSQKRRPFFERVGMPDVFVLPERPSFTGSGTDACEYAWMRWKADRSQAGKVAILYDKAQTALMLG